MNMLMFVPKIFPASAFRVHIAAVPFKSPYHFVPPSVSACFRGFVPLRIVSMLYLIRKAIV
eukprot:3951074-Heterocapsa_arctica.AAC.1